MCPHRTLKRRNIENITANSVASDEIETQRKELAAAEHRLQRMKQRILATKDRVAKARQQLYDLRNQTKVEDTKKNRRRRDTFKNRLGRLRQQRDIMLAEHRELNLMVRDQRALLKALEKKEVARQAAVARFLEEWERDYDRKMRRKKKNAQIRKNLF